MVTNADPSSNTDVGFTEMLADYILSSSQESFSSEHYEHARLAFMDWLSVSVVASQEPVTLRVLNQALTNGGNPHASLIAHPYKVSASQAAMVNGTLSHAFDYDDTLLQYMGHPTATIMPAVAAMAEWRNLSGKQLLAAYLVGLQVGCYIAAAIGPQHYHAGFHGTATVGRHGATAACSYLMGLSKQQIIYAFGIAGTETSGLRRSFGTMAKPYHAGIAAQGGVDAAMLAADGFESGEAIFEGSFGVFQAMHGQANEVDIHTFSDKHPVEMLSPKIHAACHCTHAPIEVIQAVAGERNLTADDIESVQVYCSQISLDNANKTSPRTGLESKFSINYSMANALIRQDTGLLGYTDDKVMEPEVRALMDRIKVDVDDAHRDADLKTTCHFTLKSGELISRTLDPVEEPPGLVQKLDQVGGKFDNLCGMVYGASKVKALRDQVENLVDESDIGSIIQATQALG
jgi:2-methylcitrate dehydratase PrpD